MINKQDVLNLITNMKSRLSNRGEDEIAEAVLDMVMNKVQGMEEVGEWIPCSEELPKCNGCYLVWRPHFFSGEIGMPAICYFDGQDTWHDSYGVDFTRILNEKDVVAWLPLPEPYREGQNDES